MRIISANRARDKICPIYKAAILSNSACDYRLDDLNKEPCVMCDVEKCIHWEWDTDTTGHCCQGGNNGYQDGYEAGLSDGYDKGMHDGCSGR